MGLLCDILARVVNDTLGDVEKEVQGDLLSDALEEGKAQTLAGKQINLQADALFDLFGWHDSRCRGRDCWHHTQRCAGQGTDRRVCMQEKRLKL